MAIDDFGRGETEAAMLHACNAVDGTAKKVHPTRQVGDRFTTLIRDNYDIFGLMGMGGVDVVQTRWPVRIKSTLGRNVWPDTADLVYLQHRCAHGHGDEVPQDIALIDDCIGMNSVLRVEQGKVRLPWNTIFGLIAVAVVEAVNTDQRVRDDQYLEWGNPRICFGINEWWGRKADFRAQLATQPIPIVKLDWAEWTANPPF